MAYQSLGLGAAADDGTGDTLRDGGDKINDNFLEIYTAFGSGTALTTGMTATSSVVTLTSPVMVTQVNHGDGVAAQFGVHNDLQIYHDGNDSYIAEGGTGALKITTDGGSISFQKGNTEVMATMGIDGSVALNYDNGVRLATDTAGVDITVQLDLSSHLDMPDGAYIKLGTGDDLQIHHDGSNSIIDEGGTGSLFVRGSTVIIGKTGTTEAFFQGAADGAASIYYDNVVKLATDTDGIDITGQLDLSSHLDMPDNAHIKLGTGDDLSIYHNGSDSYIIDSGTGGLNFSASSINIRNAAGNETGFAFIENGAITLYYDSAAKLATSAAGVSVTGTVTATPTAILLIKDSSGSTLKTINGIAAT